MRASDVRVRSTERGVELRAHVSCDADWVEPFDLWYRFPPQLEEHLDPRNGDPFLAALMGAAMVLAEPLAIEAEISPALAAAAPRIQSIFRTWDPNLRETEIRAPIRGVPGRPSGSGRGLFFSLGLDSFYSLLKNVRDHPSGPEAVSHLITVHGFDIYLDKPDAVVFPQMLASSTRVARELGKDLVPVTTNLRDLTDQIVNWVEIHHGAALASVGLALDGWLDPLHIAASFTYAELYPLGSHPLVDPLWSTERVSIVHDGCEATRLDKARLVAEWPIALETIRVCTEILPEYNCGRCEKCVRTMLTLHVVGALDRCTSLPNRIDIERVREMKSNPRRATHIRHIMEALGSSSFDREVHRALQEVLEGFPAGAWGYTG